MGDEEEVVIARREGLDEERDGSRQRCRGRRDCVRACGREGLDGGMNGLGGPGVQRVVKFEE